MHSKRRIPRFTLCVFLVVSAAVAAAGPAERAVATEATGYITIDAGRTFWQAGHGCVPYPGSVGLETVARELQRRGLAGYGTLAESLTAESRSCFNHDLYPSWDDLARLRDTYGWSFGSNGKDRNIMVDPGSTLAEQWNTSCGALPGLRAHGHTRGWALFAYPGGGDPNDVSDTVQRDVVSKCFAFAGSTPTSRHTAATASRWKVTAA